MYLTRDRDGKLFLHKKTPYRSNQEWLSCDAESCGFVLKNLFPNLKWEDEPLEVELMEVKR
jgi:hypothetical protein